MLLEVERRTKALGREGEVRMTLTSLSLYGLAVVFTVYTAVFIVLG
jgi:hypothetical protein